MVNVVLELFFISAIGISFIASMAVVFFLHVLDRMHDEESYRKGFLAFKVFLLSILFHLLYHVFQDFLVNPFWESIFEILALITFLTGTVILTRNALRTHISYETHINIKKELESKTDALKMYAVDLRMSNKFKDLFIDIMNHDLLNPVGVIQNYSELLEEELTEADEHQKKYVTGIRRNAKKAIEMIESASKLSKIQSGGEEEFTRLDLAAVLSEEIEHLKPNAKLKEMTLTFSGGGNNYPVEASPVIGQVFANLISNGIKYSPEKSAISIDVEERNGYWRVAVKDQGAGVDDKYKDAIFTRFERLRREGVKGTGLGLAIVKRIVEMHNGRVWVEDRPEGGSAFIVEIPKSQ